MMLLLHQPRPHPENHHRNKHPHVMQVHHGIIAWCNHMRYDDDNMRSIARFSRASCDTCAASTQACIINGTLIYRDRNIQCPI
jgi:hypothetical protein